jgi:transcriptional regulator with XRE-family HTH domain
MGGPGSGRRVDAARRQPAERLRARGLSFAEIGRRLGISREGARYLLGVARRRAPRVRPDLRCAACRRAIPGSGATGRTAGAVYCLDCLGETPEATFARRLRSLRVAHGLTRAALGRACGLSGGVVASVERDAHTPRAATVVRLVCVLGPGLYTHATPRG